MGGPATWCGRRPGWTGNQIAKRNDGLTTTIPALRPFLGHDHRRRRAHAIPQPPCPVPPSPLPRHLRHPGLVRCQSQRLRPPPRPPPFLRLPGQMVRRRARLRARHNPHVHGSGDGPGTLGRCGRGLLQAQRQAGRRGAQDAQLGGEERSGCVRGAGEGRGAEGDVDHKRGAGVCDAQVPLRVPNRRRAKGRAFEGEYRGFRAEIDGGGYGGD